MSSIVSPFVLPDEELPGTVDTSVSHVSCKDSECVNAKATQMTCVRMPPENPTLSSSDDVLLGWPHRHGGDAHAMAQVKNG